MDKKNLKTLIANNRTAEVLELMLEHARQDQLHAMERAVLLLQSAFEKCASDESLDLISYQEAKTTRNRIHAALLDLLDGKPLPDGIGPIAAGEQTPAHKRNWVLPLALAGVAILYFGVKEISLARPFSLTVFVHGKEGPHERLLRDEGKVVLHIGQDQREATINEKGEADFKEIPAKFRNNKARIVIDHPQPYQNLRPDSLYVLRPGMPIYIAVSLRNTDRLFGRVFDLHSSQPLEGVRVSVRHISVLSDGSGYFEMELPEELQAKFQRVAFQKEGYAFSEIDSVPVHTKQEIQVALKRSE